ncbi:hypothetical protein [Elizabethkingia meningoseptica]|uniref:hypothetical protein n=1 Tax=Elizabethkingia meningoseptica TaxID=238 RepID=UPI002DD664B0|nr:hypothetical protein [Elizabethkingia meningoseptica]MEC4710924.1 hypothetical protein [Elizabethkingia meningoseptica]
MKKVIGYINIAIGLFYIFNIYSNIQALFFPDFPFPKEFPKINISTQVLFYLKWLSLGILTIIAGTKLIKEKKTGWILSCTVWTDLTFWTLYSFVINLKQINAFDTPILAIQSIICIYILLVLISDTFKSQFKIEKKDWQRMFIYTAVLFLINFIY